MIDPFPPYTPDPSEWRWKFTDDARALLEARRKGAEMNRVWLVTWREKHEQGDYDAEYLVWCERSEDAIKLLQDGIEANPVPGCAWKAREFTADDFDKSTSSRPFEQWCVIKPAPEEFWGHATLDQEDFEAIRERWKQQREFAAHPKLLEV